MARLPADSSVGLSRRNALRVVRRTPPSERLRWGGLKRATASWKQRWVELVVREATVNVLRKSGRELLLALLVLLMLLLLSAHVLNSLARRSWRLACASLHIHDSLSHAEYDGNWDRAQCSACVREAWAL